MQEFIEFAGNNVLLVTGLLASGFAAIFYELRVKARNIASLSVPVAVRMINDGSKVVDIRDAEQFAAAHIVDSTNIPRADLNGESKPVKSGKNVVLVCDTGSASGDCVAQLRKDGHENVFSLRGGLAEWRKENLPLVSD
ncbi:MAG: rhodanese-like domain-containing protein [Gammaproteobacteria bacterium]|nr:rhodanese-like domain-containing protein [Gammaproteobacteria bacterium]NND55542.1 rhodanese-like domain-containing protein [Gammaproteobacteria bacterium]